MRHSALFSAIATVALLAAAPAQNIPLSPGETTTGTLATDGEVTYSVEVGPGHFVRGVVQQTGVNVAIEVMSPGNGRLGKFDGQALGAERFHFESDTAGIHRIRIRAAKGAEGERATGEFTVQLTYLEPAATDPAKLAAQLLAPYDHKDSPGAVVSVFRDGKSVFTKAVGMADLSHDAPFRADTPTNIGSTSKQFTAFAVLLLCGRGELALDDDVRKHIPELPDLGSTVTVRHLLTHTSGYREFLNLLTMAGRRLDRGDSIDRAEIVDILQRQPALQNEPGAEFNYNNSAYGIASLLVERISGIDFPTFMQQEVFGPLGMAGTQVRPSPEHIIAGRARGYRPSPEGFLDVRDLGGSMGAGGIYATVGDLQKWIANMAAARVGTEEMFQKMRTPFQLLSGKSTGYGLGLFIDEQGGLQRIHHGGADLAHRSQLVWYPEINGCITTQSNHAEFDGSITFRLAAAFFADAMTAEDPEDASEEPAGAPAVASDFDPASYDPAAFDELVGNYSLDVRPSFVLTFTREGDKLLSQATGQRQIEITPTGTLEFRVIGVEARLAFERNEAGKVDGVVLHQGGRSLHATRQAAEDEWKPSPEEFTGFTGRYFSRELETFYTLRLEDGDLVVHHRRMDDLTIKPVDKDLFTGGTFEFSFERDRNGQLLGFYLSNGRTRNVRFELLP